MSRLTLATLGAFSAVALCGPLASSQTPQTTTRRSVETSIAEALANDPITAPYRISFESRGGKIVLKGRVGSKAVHDIVVRTAIAYGVPIGDDLIIDTTTSPVIQSASPLSLIGGPIPFNAATYPPPLFGRYYDPFYLFDPPLATYPPWWGEMSRHRLAMNQPAATPRAPAAAEPLPANTVELTIDPLGVGVIRGTVPSEVDKAEIGEHMLQVEGVTKIINRLTVDPSLPGGQPDATTPAGDDQPPPPPTPVVMKSVDSPVLSPAKPPRRVETTSLPPKGAMSRVDRALQTRPELAGTGVKVSLRDGVATLSGTVPSVFEAMVAYRAVEQTPGVKQVVDTLEFTVPDGSSPNPLITKAVPDDAEPYLASQIRRQVGDAAHVDRVRIGGNQLEIKGTLDRADDRPRVEAILRSMPILRGFTILPEFRSTDG